MTYDITKKTRKTTPAYDFLDVYDYTWVSNDHLAYTVWHNKYYYHNLCSVDRNLNGAEPILAQWSEVIDGLLAEPDYALVHKYYSPKYSLLGKVNIHTGMMKNKQRVRSAILWVKTDFEGMPVLLSTYRNKIPSLTLKDPVTKQWVPIMRHRKEGEYNIYTCLPSDKTKLYVTHYYNREKKCLYVYNTKTDTLESMVFSDSLFDFEGELYFFHNPFEKPESAYLRGVSYETDYPKSVWFDPVLKQVQENIDRRLPNTVNNIIDANCDRSVLLFIAYSDIVPKKYYVYYTATDKMELLFESRPWIKTGQLSETTPIAFSTRDSLLLHGYLTKPLEGEAPFPTVILLHGGPHTRDYWGFDPEVQLLANRGYAVVQINYRGSTGFGYSISERDKFKFGKMYRDVIDGALYVINSGVADVNRIAVMGASFGGYLSLCCVANEPDLFRCAVSEAGVFDWGKLVSYKRNEYNNYVYDYLKKNITDDSSADYLKDISPIHKAKNIKVPVFLSGGTNDENVSIYQSFKLEQILTNNGVHVETFFKAGEGHGFVSARSKVTYYSRVIDFLNRNMK